MGIDPGEVRGDLVEIIDRLELLQVEYLKKKKDKESEYTMTEKEKDDALAYLKDAKLIENIIRDAERCGHVGEEKNFLLGYLVSISRKLHNPLGLFIISQSGAGKTALQDAVLSFTPDEDYEKLTRLTDQSLFYQGENALVPKLIAIEEEEGASGAGY